MAFIHHKSKCEHNCAALTTPLGDTLINDTRLEKKADILNVTRNTYGCLDEKSLHE